MLSGLIFNFIFCLLSWPMSKTVRKCEQSDIHIFLLSSLNVVTGGGLWGHDWPGWNLGEPVRTPVWQGHCERRYRRGVQGAEGRPGEAGTGRGPVDSRRVGLLVANKSPEKLRSPVWLDLNLEFLSCFTYFSVHNQVVWLKQFCPVWCKQKHTLSLSASICLVASSSVGIWLKSRQLAGQRGKNRERLQSLWLSVILPCQVANISM